MEPIPLNQEQLNAILLQYLLINGTRAMTGDLNMDDNGVVNISALDFDLDHVPDLESEGKIWWNNLEKTLNISTGWGPVLQVGHEDYVLVHNATGDTIDNGSPVYPVGSVGGVGSIALCDAVTHEKIDRGFAVTTMDIPDGQNGIVVTRGTARGLDTSGLTLGAPVYIGLTPGTITDIRPSFPNYVILLGGVSVKDDTDGQIVIGATGTYTDTFQNFWNGNFREMFDFRVTSDGVTVTGTLTPSNGQPDMTMMFSDGFQMLDTDPGATIELTPGTDENPQMNYIYIPKTTKVLTLSTSGWIPEENIKVAKIYVQSAAAVMTGGALANQNTNNEIQDTVNNQGDVSHINDRLRAMPADWDSGAETFLTGTGADDVLIQTTGGKVFQKHLQDFPSQDMTQYNIDAVNQVGKTFTISGDGDLSSTYYIGKILHVHNSTGNDKLYTIDGVNWSDPDFIISVEETIPNATADGTIGDDIHVVNDPVTAFRDSINLNDITVDSAGGSLNNRWFSIVIWGVANKTGEPSHLMCNLPSDSYAIESDAIEDADNFSDYSIPREFRGTGFLQARYTIRKSGTVFIYNGGDAYADLRESGAPAGGGGGGGGGGATTLLGLTDMPSTYAGAAGMPFVVNAGETAGEFAHLDETGTFEVSLTFGGGKVDMIDFGFGRYIFNPVTRLVQITLKWQLVIKGTSAGQARFEGLPFPISSGVFDDSAIVLNTGFVFYSDLLAGKLERTKDYMTLINIPRAAPTSILGQGAFSNGTTVVATGFYFTDDA